MVQDKISLEGMIFYGFHGIKPAEQELGQRFVVDLEVRRDLRPAGLSDDPDDTVNYSRMYRLVKEIMEGPSHKLLESLAETIAWQILDGFDVESVLVRVMKPEVPMKGSILSNASVEILRERGK
ncbi:MAG: dihydroneopterin aldolase [SAR202 cluster bacterium]|jgi:dihydroneopterin aldolase|nr:dihydroneopterin aldolase [SAR202 cluster bacterium]|tara:strand:+ start:493 stop:864 length:372 start_codon:yes stop_codon:yes gene_type:complete